MPLYLAAKLQIKIERTKKKGEKLKSCSVTTHHPYEFTIFLMMQSYILHNNWQKMGILEYYRYSKLGILEYLWQKNLGSLDSVHDYLSVVN